MSNTINSVSPSFRDFLLNKNLISDTISNNGLEGLLDGIGVPYGGIGVFPESVQPSVDILEDGEFYKDLNLVSNKFQGNDDDYRLVSIINQSTSNPSTSAIIYSSSYVDNGGLLNETLNAKPTGPFQGGDIREFNTSKNLYDDAEKRILVNFDDISTPSVKYTNYLDLNSSIVNSAIDVLSTIFNGDTVSTNNSKLVPSFDLRAALIGRNLAGSGVNSDTPLGQAGAKYLALSLANNMAFNLSQETVGNINLSPLNIIKNGGKGIIVPNYDITVPSGKLGKVVDFGAKILGFEVPVSLLSMGASIFQKENPISNIDRANAQLLNTGKGQVVSLFNNISENTFKAGYKDERVVKNELNSNVYAFGTGDGKIIDFLNNNVDLNGDGTISYDEYDINTPISQSNYRLSGLINDSGFGEASDGVMNDGGVPFSWADDKANRDSFSNAYFNEPKSLLYKTQNLFRSNKMRSIISGHGGDGTHGKSQIESSIQLGLISKGSGALSNQAVIGFPLSPNEANDQNPADVFCRTWTTLDRYEQVLDLQKSSGINTDTVYRKGYTDGDSVLGDNGFVKVGSYKGDVNNNNIKNYMLSLENLAWSDDLTNLLNCEIGPGDNTGRRGRIMWFPPYDINVNENVSVNWESTNFIGRGEPIYTYNNTERTGTLQFKIVVDHPSYLNAIRGESDEYLSSFFAGCTDISSEIAEKLTITEKNAIDINKTILEKSGKDIEEQLPDISLLTVYFPNDVSELNPAYENLYSSEIGTGLITTEDSGTVSLTKTTSNDRTNFGLNGDKNDTLGDVGGWISEEGKAKLKDTLNVKCPACVISIKGYASTQGNDINKKGNKSIQFDRAFILRTWLEDNILIEDENIISGKITLDDRFKPKGSVAGGVIGPSSGDDDSLEMKQSRKAVANYSFDSDLASKLLGDDKEGATTTAPNNRVSEKILNRFYNECNYFEKLEQESPTVYNTLKEKLKYFQPAFHAITPEGLNSRLTFLQQCTRQGPTDIDGVSDNLAFGRPPVCILRLGDFYHTKIVIDNIGISYEPLVWDLNPEGIGVQPMIATVDLSYKMIGGQSLKGPINKLQNAVSFNYFANTQVYDERSDTINSDGTINQGHKNIKSDVESFIEQEIIDNTISVNEVQKAENSLAPEAEEEIAPKITGIDYIEIITDETDYYSLRVVATHQDIYDDSGEIIEIIETEELVDKGIKLRLTDNAGNLIVEEVISELDGNPSKDAESLFKTGYYFGTQFTGSYGLNFVLSEGNYNVSIHNGGNRIGIKNIILDNTNYYAN
jgi:hypothetical protein